MPPRILALVTSIALASAPTVAVAAEPAADATAKREPVHADLVLEVELGEGSPVIAERVRKRAEELLRKHDVQPSRGADDPRLVVRITPVSGTPGYDVGVSVHDAKGPIANTAITSACNMCTEGELVDHVERAIGDVIPQIPVETAPPPEPKVDPSTSPSTTVTPDVAPRDRSLTPIGKAGIGVAAVGVAGAIAGAVIMTRPTKELEDELETDRVEYRVPGIAVLAGGLGVLVVGIALIGIDRARVKKRNAQTASRFGVLRF